MPHIILLFGLGGLGFFFVASWSVGLSTHGSLCVCVCASLVLDSICLRNATFVLSIVSCNCDIDLAFCLYSSVRTHTALLLISNSATACKGERESDSWRERVVHSEGPMPELLYFHIAVLNRSLDCNRRSKVD